MTDTERILLERGIELCDLWDRYDYALRHATEKGDRRFSESNRQDAGTRLDEVCRLASEMGIATYDDFRRTIQKGFKAKKEGNK